MGDRLREASQIVSPTGDVYSAEPAPFDTFSELVLRRFESRAEAVNYVSGTWQATGRTGLASSETRTISFDVDPAISSIINPVLPTLVSPSPGQVIENGSTFLLGWDYPGSDDDPNESTIAFAPQLDLFRRRIQSIVSTPTPDSFSFSSGSFSTGNYQFDRTLKNVAGTDINRFLTTLTATETPFPLDVEITLGSYTSLDESVTWDEQIGEGTSSAPLIRMFYVREIDPFTITLTAVPEPCTLFLLLGALAAIATCRRC